MGGRSAAPWAVTLLVMVRLASAVVGLFVLAAPAHANPGDLDRGFGDHGRLVVRTSAVVAGMTLVDERRPLLTVQPSKGDESSGVPFTVAVSAAGRVLGRAPVPAPAPLALPAGFEVRTSGVDGAGRTVVVGHASPGDDRALRFLPDGALDTSYGTDGGVDLMALADPFAIVVKPDGRAHIFDEDSQMLLDPAGRSLLPSTEPSLSWPRLNQPGGVDTVADGPGDTVLVAGRSIDDDPFVMRIGADGRLDRGFGTRGFAHLQSAGWFIPAGITRDQRGRLLVGGTTNARAIVVRLTSKGRFDRSFGNAGRTRIAPPRGLKGWDAHFLRLDAHDRIVVAGSGWTKDQDVGAFRPVIARLSGG